jgi:hypothetical protein
VKFTEWYHFVFSGQKSATFPQVVCNLCKFSIWNQLIENLTSGVHLSVLTWQKHAAVGAWEGEYHGSLLEPSPCAPAAHEAPPEIMLGQIGME